MKVKKKAIQRPSFKEALRAMPNVGEDVDFECGAETEKYPGVRFRASVGGHEAYMQGHRVAVWEVIEMYPECKSVAKTAAHFSWAPALVRAALAYAKAFPGEIERQRQAEVFLSDIHKVTSILDRRTNVTDVKLCWLLTKKKALGGKSPLSLIEAGKVDRVVTAAKNFMRPGVGHEGVLSKAARRNRLAEQF